MMTYNEWLKSQDGIATATTILASSADMYPDRFAIDQQLRRAYESYKTFEGREKDVYKDVS